MMFESEQLQEIAGTLKKNRLRSFLTIFGVFWGIFILVVMLGAGQGLQNGVYQEFDKSATNSVFIWTNQTSLPYQGYPRGRSFFFNTDDVAALRKEISEIQHLAPRSRIMSSLQGDNNVSRGNRSGAFTIYGDYPEIQNIYNAALVDGRFINQMDLSEKRKVAVIGTRVREVMFRPEENPVGRYIEISGVYFQVIGLFEVEGINESDEDRQTIILPLTTFQQVNNQGDTIHWLALTAADEVPAAVVERKALSLLARRHSVSSEDVNAFGHYNVEQDYLKVKRLFAGIKALIWFVGIFSLIAGVIGVGNIMLIIVKERTKEIGIRRAVGATPYAVVKQIILETILLTATAGYGGLVAGVAVLELIAYLLPRLAGKVEMFNQPGIDLQIGLAAVGILILSGAVAGLIPAMRAVSVRPVDAIRSD